MRGLRVTGILLAVCLVAAAWMAVPAFGAAASKISVGIGYESPSPEPFFKGRVTSTRRSCVANRVVVVYRVGNQGRRVRFRATRTDSSGRWRIDMSSRMKKAGYLASVRTRGSCAPAPSKSIAVGQGGPGGIG